jgi:hypothetical protein
VVVVVVVVVVVLVVRIAVVVLYVVGVFGIEEYQIRDSERDDIVADKRLTLITG